MKNIDINTESFEYEHQNLLFRAIPFYELSIEEWVIYQNNQPKYYLNLDKRESSFQSQIRTLLENGTDLETAINRIGIFLGLEWTTQHNIQGEERKDSFKSEIISLEEINDFGEIAHDLLFVATNGIDIKLLQNEDNVIKGQFIDCQLNLESCVMDRYENISRLINFIFPTDIQTTVIFKNDDIEIIDLSPIREILIDEIDLENNYKNWIEESERNNTMDEYGALIGILGYVKRNVNKKHLILRIEKRKTVPNN